MKLTVIVKPNSKRPGIERTGEREYVVRVNAPAQDGRANRAAVKALAEHLKIPPSRITIIRGTASKRKVVEIM